MTYESIFSARIVNIWNSLPNSGVDASIRKETEKIIEYDHFRLALE